MTWTPRGLDIVKDPVHPVTTGVTLGLKATGRLLVKPYLEIQASSLGGMGIFASQDIEAGKLVLIERPLLSTNTAGLLRTIRHLSVTGKEVFMSLHPFHPHPDASQIEQLWGANA